MDNFHIFFFIARAGRLCVADSSCGSVRCCRTVPYLALSCAILSTVLAPARTVWPVLLRVPFVLSFWPRRATDQFPVSTPWRCRKMLLLLFHRISRTWDPVCAQRLEDFPVLPLQGRSYCRRSFATLSMSCLSRQHALTRRMPCPALAVPQELQDEAEPAQGALDKGLPQVGRQRNDRRLGL